MNEEAIFVLHVKQGYEDRGRHIERMMAAHGLRFDYVLDGDIGDLTDEWQSRTFSGLMARTTPNLRSCTAKHLLAMKRILDENLHGALILEDDIVLRPSFNDVFDATMRELSAMDAGIPTIISYEDTRLRFVKHSQRRRGQYLYPGDRDRMAGCYYANSAAAHLITKIADAGGIDLPIDLLHNRLLHDGSLRYLWCQPTVASQGSFVGMFDSSLTGERRRITGILWHLKLWYKRLLYRLR